MFKPPYSLGLQVAPTAVAICSQGSHAVYPTHNSGGSLPRDVVLLHVRIGQLTWRDFHSLDCDLVGCSPPPCPASVLSPSWVLHLGFSLTIGTTGSHVPHMSLIQVRATFMPDAPPRQYAGFSPGLILVSHKLPVLTSSNFISTPHQWFACARLPEPHLIPSCGTFSLTLTTLAFDQSSLRWFGACPCKPAPRDLPSSLVQLRGALTGGNQELQLNS